MATLSELFVLLDGWADQAFSEGVQLTPDPALAAARSALASGAGLEDALAAVEQQIAVAVPALRAARYDLIAAASRWDREPTVSLLRHMLCDLHLAAFRIQRRRGAIDDARAHLVRAVATESGDGTPRLYFVEFYVEAGEYAAAVDTLAAAMGRDRLGAFSLLRLGVDLVSRGAIQEALTAFERAGEIDLAGLVTSVCRVLTEGLDRTGPEQPATDELQAAFSSAGDALGDGREQDALEGFLFVVSHDPTAAPAWFGVGCAHRNSVEREEATLHGEAADRVLALAEHRREAVTEDAHTRMSYAAEAFRLALALHPTMWPAADALVWAELWLDRPDEGLAPALRAAREQPGNPDALATLSIALLMNGVFDDAKKAATAAVDRDPGHPVASKTLAIVRELTHDMPAP
jgi:tetratricopeptide (TPR) repeat protein